MSGSPSKLANKYFSNNLDSLKSKHQGSTEKMMKIADQSTPLKNNFVSQFKHDYTRPARHVNIADVEAETLARLNKSRSLANFPKQTAKKQERTKDILSDLLEISRRSKDDLKTHKNVKGFRGSTVAPKEPLATTRYEDKPSQNLVTSKTFIQTPGVPSKNEVDKSFSKPRNSHQY